MTYIVLFFIFASVFLTHLAFKLYFLQKQMVKLSTRAVLQKVLIGDEKVFFSTDILKRVVRILFFTPDKKARKVLFYLCNGRIEPACDYLLKKKQEYLATMLSAFFDVHGALNLLRELPSNEEIKAKMVLLLTILKQKEEAKDILNGIATQNLSSVSRAEIYYCRAKYALEVGDLYNAAEDCSRAIDLLGKNHCRYEEARAYILMGEIYRISAAVDTADFMLRAAMEIADKLRADTLKSCICGHQGMLYTMAERFDEAREAFLKAIDINKQAANGAANDDIYNQLALLEIITQNYDLATEYVNQALNSSSPQAKAFALELMAKIYRAENKTREAQEAAKMAQKMYLRCKNMTAYFEVTYLSALISFETKEYVDAEEELQNLIDEVNENETAFYKANAYSLYGMTCMAQNNFSKAKTMFEESVRFELKNGREEGLFSDYINLGLVAQKTKKYEEAEKYYVEAVECAKRLQNDKLEHVAGQYLSELPQK